MFCLSQNMFLSFDILGCCFFFGLFEWSVSSELIQVIVLFVRSILTYICSGWLRIQSISWSGLSFPMQMLWIAVNNGNLFANRNYQEKELIIWNKCKCFDLQKYSKKEIKIILVFHWFVGEHVVDLFSGDWSLQFLTIQHLFLKLFNGFWAGYKGFRYFTVTSTCCFVIILGWISSKVSHYYYGIICSYHSRLWSNQQYRNFQRMYLFWNRGRRPRRI